MAVTRFSNSGLGAGMTKYDDMLAGYPPKMATPTAADGGTGTSATVSFTAVSGATGYRAISTPGSFTGTGSSSPVTVSGLTAGTAYTFQIQAQNSVGYGAYSEASNSVTPVTPTAFDSIATVTVSSPTSSISFTSIPQTYKSLQIRAIGRATGSSTSEVVWNMDVNSSASSWSRHQLTGNGTTVSANASAGPDSAGRGMFAAGGGTTANIFGATIIDIIDYASTSKTKTFRHFSGVDFNGSGFIALHSNLWNSTSAITSITFSPNQANTNTTFALYGVK